MKNLTVEDILKVTKGELIKGNEKLECENFSRDTRNIQKGDTYVAIKGEKFDGNIFWKAAFKNGADCVIVQDIEFSNEDLKDLDNKTIIKVEDTMQALYKIASYKREINNIPVVAITGSVGKTSTKDMVASVVSQKYKTLKTIGNNNNNIGLPFTILRLKDEEIMILEMGMNHFGEIHLLSNIAKPNICVITNIGTSHIGNLGSKENILKAKLEILDGAENPTIIINNDDELLHKWYLENKDSKKIITYGIENKSDIMAKDMILEQEKSTYKCNIDGKEMDVEVPIAGRHFVLNSLCATTVGIALNIDINNSYKEAKTRIEFFKHRIEDNDCYKLFYNEDEQIITTENDLQRMFKFVWHKSIFKDDAETNNGRGPADFVISMGSADVTVIEFKLAKNTNLDHVFEQVKIYKKANNTEKHIVVIFYFNDREYEKALKSLKTTGTENIVNENVFLIDCRLKESASKPTAKA